VFLQISIKRVFFTGNGFFVIYSNHFFTVYKTGMGTIFLMAVTGISNSKVRSHFFYYKNWQKRQNIIFSCHLISQSVCADSKFTNRKWFMGQKQVFINIFFPFFRVFKISAGIILYPSVFKVNFQIKIA